MTSFKVIERQCPECGNTYPEYDKFARYGSSPTWIPLLVGVNKVKFFAACNLEAGGSAVDTGLRYSCEPPAWYLEWEFIQWDIAITEYEIEALRDPIHHDARRAYVNDLQQQIDAALAEPPPMYIFPMPDVFPQAVFLAAANYVLHLEAAKVDPKQAQQSAKKIIKAVADGQLPKAA